MFIEPKIVDFNISIANPIVVSPVAIHKIKIAIKKIIIELKYIDITEKYKKKIIQNISDNSNKLIRLENEKINPIKFININIKKKSNQVKDTLILSR